MNIDKLLGSFLIGFGSVLNIWGNYFNFEVLLQESDNEALSNDFWTIAEDFNRILEDMNEGITIQ